MTFFTALITFVGLAGLSWMVLKEIARNEKVRSKEPQRGRSVDIEGGTGSRPRSSSSTNHSTRSTKKNNTVVKHQEKPYWKRRGWKKHNGDLTGYYRTKYGNFKGRIDDIRSNPKVYIYNPPKQLNNHTHSSCFFSEGGGKFKVHFKQSIYQPSIAIQTVEKILRESYKNS